MPSISTPNIDRLTNIEYIMRTKIRFYSEYGLFVYVPYPYFCTSMESKDRWNCTVHYYILLVPVWRLVVDQNVPYLHLHVPAWSLVIDEFVPYRILLVPLLPREKKACMNLSSAGLGGGEGLNLSPLFPMYMLLGSWVSFVYDLFGIKLICLRSELNIATFFSMSRFKQISPYRRDS